MNLGKLPTLEDKKNTHSPGNRRRKKVTDFRNLVLRIGGKRSQAASGLALAREKAGWPGRRLNNGDDLVEKSCGW